MHTYSLALGLCLQLLLYHARVDDMVSIRYSRTVSKAHPKGQETLSAKFTMREAQARTKVISWSPCPMTALQEQWSRSQQQHPEPSIKDNLSKHMMSFFVPYTERASRLLFMAE